MEGTKPVAGRDVTTTLQFGKLVYDKMRERQQTIEDLAAESGLSTSTICSCLNNYSSPNLRTMKLLLRTFGMHLEAVPDNMGVMD